MSNASIYLISFLVIPQFISMTVKGLKHLASPIHLENENIFTALWISRLPIGKPFFALNPFAHFLSPTKKRLKGMPVVDLLDLDRGGSSTQQERHTLKPLLPSIHKHWATTPVR